MTQDIIREVVEKLALEAKRVFGTDLKSVVLYGSCARGDYTTESDIDVMILLDLPVEELEEARKKISDISSKLDWDYDVVITPVLQSYQVFQKYISVSSFYQNVQKEGVLIA